MYVARMLCCLAFLAACIEVPPAWVPGDAPLRVWSEDEEALLLALHACDVWAATDVHLECVVDDSADVVWLMDPLDPETRAKTVYEWQVPGWRYWTLVRTSNSREMKELDAVHEMGHLLGAWEHVEAGPAVMTSTPTSAVLMEVDLQAVRNAW